MENRGKRQKLTCASSRLLFIIFCLVLSREAYAQIDFEGHENIISESTSRLLEVTKDNIPPVSVSSARRGPILLFKNIFELEEQDLKYAIVRPFNPSEPSSSPRPPYPTTSIHFANTPQWILVNLEEGVNIDNQYLQLVIPWEGQKGELTINSHETVYHYSSSSASGTLTFSLVLAIIYMAFSCICWACGVRQFYHLIKIAQMLYMVNLLASRPKSALIYSYLEGFRHNIFNIIPNPVVIDEFNGVECQPAIEFFSEGWSCHAYNSLRNYVLGFIIYIVLYCFVKVNKFHEVAYWNNLKDAFKIKVFMLTIMPDVLIAIYVNAAGGPYNSVMSLGFLFCLLLIFWYGYIIASYFSLWIERNDDFICFMHHFVFSRTPLSIRDSRLGVKFMAVMLDQLKIIIIVTMIGLFNNAPKTQLVIVFLAYLLHAIFLFVVRPWNGLGQNILFGLSDLCFFILVLLIFVSHSGFFTYSTSYKEDNLATGQAVMYFLILACNLIVFAIPILKGHDKSTVTPQVSADNLVRQDSVSSFNDHHGPEISEEDRIKLGQAIKELNNKPGSTKVPVREVVTSDGQTSNPVFTRN
jgi:hypothetical protein